MIAPRRRGSGLFFRQPNDTILAEISARVRNLEPASVTINGSAVSSGSSLNEDDEVEISITPVEGQVPTATINGSSIELSENDGVYTGNFAMPGQASSLVINTGTTSGGGGGSDGLDMGG